YQVIQRDFSAQGVQVALKNGTTLFYGVGGPYTMDGAENIMVGDVWVLAGQSNMRGFAYFKDPWTHKDTEKLIHDKTFHLFDMTENWSVAKDPVHELSKSIRNVNYNIQDGTVTNPELPLIRGGSLALSFAKKYQELIEKDVGKKVPVGLIASAHGGVTLDQWSPTLLRDSSQWKNDTLYGAMLGRIEASGSNKIAGILWYQGESDTRNITLASTYKTRMKSWIDHARTDLNSSNLNVVQVQIARELADGNYDLGWSLVRAAQAALIDKNVATVSSVDCPLDDRIHLSLKGQYMMGDRVAIAAHAVMNNKGTMVSPYIQSVEYEKGNTSRPPALRLTFGNVSSFKKVEAPQGFSLHNTETGIEEAIIFKTAIYGSTVRILLASEIGNKTLDLYYGYGKNPISNIVSTGGMGLLTF
ncbi:SGNH hydrolase-type esterase domain-containing protein, partial [Mucor mucedo]|uniref:SGNH hydrolase-type esterase domain-containing protein n=1 Tax=Mucor mucedo TaxID=29922 RepID=UPI0022205247